MNVAQTILSQIKAIDARALWAWGAKDLVNTGAGLQFRVGGMAKFKGLVHVKYNAGADLYTIEFSKVRKGLPTVVNSVSDVYAESLVNEIDRVVQ